jgi:alcohol dehydrogenase
MRNFELQIPTRVIFGAGSVDKLAEIAPLYGKKALLVTTGDDLAKVGILSRVADLVERSGIEVVVYKDVEPNPKTYNVDNGVVKFAENHCDFTIGLGGGSAMDTAKAIAMVAYNGGSVVDYLPGGKRVDDNITETMPCICITTTAGTGSEVSFFSVVTIPETKQKPSCGYPCMMAKVAIVDPELMLTVPPRITAATGLDVFFHAMETYLSKGASMFSDMCSLEAMRLVSENLEIVYRDGSNLDSRSKMAWANTLGGFSLMQALAVAIHAMGHSISGITDIAHGASLCITGPSYLKYTWEANIERYARVAHILGASDSLSAREAAKSCGDLLKAYLSKFGLDLSLTSVGLKEDDLDKIVDDAFSATGGLIVTSLMKLEKSDIKKILIMAL